MKVFVVVFGPAYEKGDVDSVYKDKDLAEKRADSLRNDEIFDEYGYEIIADWVEVTEIEVK